MDPLSPYFQQLEATILALKPVIINGMGKEGLRFIDDNFAAQAFRGAVYTKWAPPANPGKKSGRAILVLTGALRRSFRALEGAESVIIGTDILYARIHNEGGETHHYAQSRILSFDKTPAHGLWRFGKTRTINQQRGIKAIRRAEFKERTTKMPQRQFLGESPILNSALERYVTREVLAHLIK